MILQAGVLPLTDLHLALDAGLAAVAVVDLRLVVVIHDFDKLAGDGRALHVHAAQTRTYNCCTFHSGEIT